MTKKFITCEFLLNRGENSVIDVDADTVVTPAAYEMAAKMNIKFNFLARQEKEPTESGYSREELVQHIVKAVLKEPSLSDVSKDELSRIVKKIIQFIENNNGDVDEVIQNIRCKYKNRMGTRVIISSVGRDQPGIMAGITEILNRYGVSIVDISQTIVKGFFTMIMIVDISNCRVDFKTLRENLISRGRELKIKIFAQHEDIFNYMHRIM